MLYRKIKRLCKEQGINVRQLEIQAGINEGTICKWNDSMPSAERLHKVATILGTTVEEIFAMSEEEGEE